MLSQSYLTRFPTKLSASSLHRNGQEEEEGKPGGWGWPQVFCQSGRTQSRGAQPLQAGDEPPQGREVTPYLSVIYIVSSIWVASSMSYPNTEA